MMNMVFFSLCHIISLTFDVLYEQENKELLLLVMYEAI